MRSVPICALVAAACFPAAASAQTVSLTEAEALARLSSQSPRVAAVRAAIDVARADVLAAQRWPNPRVSWSREAVAAVAEHYFTVTQPLPLSGRRRFAASAASARVEAAASRGDDQVSRLRADLRLAFTDLQFAQAREEELASSRDRLRDLATVLERRELAGESAGFDRLRAEREVVELEADRADAATERIHAQGRMAAFFAAVPAGNIRVTATPAPANPLPSLDELVARAEKRAAFQALQRELDAATFAARGAARLTVPEPEVVAGTKSSSFGAGDVGSILSLHVSLPLFDRGAPERAAAAARAAQVRAETDALRVMTRAQIDAWRSAIVERRRIAAEYREAVTDAAAEIERIAEVSYEAGERGILDVLDAYRGGAAARVRQAMLDAAVREAEIELEYVSGWELP